MGNVRQRWVSGICVWLLCCGAVLSCAAVRADDAAAERAKVVAEAFRKADRNNDGSLSADEYVGQRPQAQVLLRDFKMFDADQDEKLSLAEFDVIALGVERDKRGAMRDLIQSIVDDFVAEFDRDLNDWDARPNEMVGLNAFARALAAKIPQEVVFTADANRDGKVSRAEAREFIEVQMGVRRNGVLLRLPNGLVNNLQYFLGMDRNQNDHLERAEFMPSIPVAQADELFDQGDKNRDGRMSLAEWAAMPGMWLDPIHDFRALDTNLDALVDADELLAGTPDWKKPVCKRILPAFDFNGDGDLSLDEYRVCPHANTLLHWVPTMTDSDHDQKLSFAEYKYDRPMFSLLRVFFFRCYDLNHDGVLALDEYDFKTLKPGTLYSLRQAGNENVLTKLSYGAKNVHCGSQCVSPDGKWIAFDGKDRYEATLAEYKIMVIPIAGGEPKIIGTGLMPSYSPDGKKVACSRITTNWGVWIMDLDGGEPEYIGRGWGAEWSPDGKQIYFGEYAARSSLRVYDLATKTIKVVVSPDEKEHQWIEINSNWSPDSQRLCLRGSKSTREDDPVMLLVNMRGDVKDRVTVRYRPPPGKGLSADFAWHPNGRRIVFSSFCDERQRRQFYELDPDTNDPPKLVAGQPENENPCESAWTPDGKQLILTFHPD